MTLPLISMIFYEAQCSYYDIRFLRRIEMHDFRTENPGCLLHHQTKSYRIGVDTQKPHLSQMCNIPACHLMTAEHHNQKVTSLAKEFVMKLFMAQYSIIFIFTIEERHWAINVFLALWGEFHNEIDFLFDNQLMSVLVEGEKRMVLLLVHWPKRVGKL